jgi:hypothetical protein
MGLKDAEILMLRHQHGQLCAALLRKGTTCTNIPDNGITGVPGSHHPQYIDVAHREHAVVETGAADLAAWTRLLGHFDNAGLREADPDTPRT